MEEKIGALKLGNHGNEEEKSSPSEEIRNLWGLSVMRWGILK